MKKIHSFFKGIVAFLLVFNISFIGEGAGMVTKAPLVNWPQGTTEVQEITILGKGEISQEQMTAFILSRNPQPKLNCSVEELVNYYYLEAEHEGVRGDIALCQALKETGFFRYGNDVLWQQNNYCGLGATGNGARGYSFMNPQRGARAHIQHLLAYASKELPKENLIDPRYEILCKNYPKYHGNIKYWVELNGKWAVPGNNYGQEIIALWQEAQGVEYQDAALAMAYDKVRKNPQSLEAYERRAYLSYQQGLFESSLRDYAMVIRLDKYRTSAYISRGRIFREWGRYKQAIDEYKKALTIAANNREALLGLGQVYVLADEREKALECYKLLLKLNPKDEMALYNKGWLEAGAGRYQQALEDFKGASLILPDNELIAESIRLVEAEIE